MLYPSKGFSRFYLRNLYCGYLLVCCSYFNSNKEVEIMNCPHTVASYSPLDNHLRFDLRLLFLVEESPACLILSYIILDLNLHINIQMPICD